MMPRTLLARSFVLLAALVLATTFAWLSLFRFLDAEPRARETAQLATSAVNLIRAAIYAAAPENRPLLLFDFSTREGMRLLPAEKADHVDALPDTRFFRLIQEELVRQLGPRTRTARAVEGIPGFWVSFRFDEQDEDEFWLVLPDERATHGFASHWIAWGLLALLLVLLMAGFIASRLSRPLRIMAQTAIRLGRGEHPPPIPEAGAEELRHLARAFNTMAANLLQHERDRSEVLAGISHDLRTPLTRLRLEAEMSIADPVAREGVIADLGQMESVISQFMDYARTDAGEPPEIRDIGQFVSQLVARHAGRGQATECQTPISVSLSIRPKALARALNNLIDNAWKYGATQVAVELHRQPGLLCIDVIDNGPGIPEDQVERLKRPFTRLEQARTDAAGTGLGLAIVDRVARLHAGRLELLPGETGGLVARLALALPDDQPARA